MTRTQQIKIILAFIAIYFIWGSTYLGIRITVHTIPPFISVATRFLVSGLILYTFLRMRGVAKPTLTQWRSATITGILLICVAMGAVYWAEQYIPSGIAALIVTIMPLWFVLFDWLILRTAIPKWTAWLGMASGTTGVVLLVGFSPDLFQGEVLILPCLAVVGGSMCWCIGSLYNKKSQDKHPHPLMDITLQMVVGGVLNFAIATARGEWNQFQITEVGAPAAWAMLYLIIFGSFIAYPAYMFLILNVRSSLVSTYSYVNPIVAVFLGWLILNEVIDKNMVYASVFILVGITLIKLEQFPKNLFGRKRVPAT